MKNFNNKKRKRILGKEEKETIPYFKFQKVDCFIPIETKYEKSRKDLLNNKIIDNIILNNNIEPEIAYKYLSKYFQKSNKFEYLKEALTSEYYKDLFKNEQSNPLTIILKIFNEIINKNETEFNKILKNIKFIGYNLPLIYGIERVRFNYYLWLIKKRIKYNNVFANDLSNFSYYLKFLNNLNHEEKCNQKEIDMIFYQFILEITENVYQNSIKVYRIPTFYNKINPEFTELKNIEKDTFIGNLTNIKNENFVKKLNDSEYYVTNGIESTTINEKNYNIEKLANDINDYRYYPLQLLLYRNESINYYYTHNKTFIEREENELFNSFKNYFFEFITSINFKNVFSISEYKYAREFLKNKEIKNILLNDKYFKFIPIYNEIFSGFTNKDILLTTISAYPSIVKIFPTIYDKEAYNDIKNFCLLMSIGEKFLTLLHEQVIHFIYGYLHHLTNKDYIKDSPKSLKQRIKEDNEENEESEENEDDNVDDGGYFFEIQLFGHIIRELTIMNVIALLDGESTKKTNHEFKEIFNSNLNKKKLMNMIKNCSGFLKEFLKYRPINFDNIFKIIKNLKSACIYAKGKTEPYIELPIYINFDYIKLREKKKETINLEEKK